MTITDSRLPGSLGEDDPGAGLLSPVKHSTIPLSHIAVWVLLALPFWAAIAYVVHAVTS